jgi:endo-1,4-beta-D-glucanase Y
MMPPILSKSLKSATLALLLAVASTWAAMLYPGSMPRVSTPYDTILKKTWEGIKKRNIDAYSTGMVHRPRSEYPGDAVSEGISYGMILALYCNDQTSFNKIWNGAETYMWSADGKLYNWHRNSQGGSGGVGAYSDGPASDAEQDIALLLIFADQLVKNNIWKAYTDPKNNATYAGRARDLLGTIRTSMVKDGKILLPGHWGENDPGTVNPSYFSPASYEVFAEFDTANASAWKALIGGSYEMLEKSKGYARGLAPDWFTFDGNSTGGAGYNAYFAGDAMYMDAIRVFWKIGLHAIWYNDARAKSYLNKAITFLGSPEKADFFTMAGALLPDSAIDEISDGKGGKVERPRRMHNHLTVGMWGIAAMAAGGVALAEGYSNEFLKFYDDGNDFFAHASDPAGGNDTLRCDMYYDQFLGWFGAAVFGGVFTNVWEDLKNGVPQGPPDWKHRPVLTPATLDIDASLEPLRVAASFTSRARWTVTLKHDSTGATRTFTAVSDTVDVNWYGISEAGTYMPQGYYSVTVTADGLAGAPYYVNKVWLGRPKPIENVNLMEGNRLLVDDFADGDAIPYIGKEWKNYLDANDGAGSSTGTISVGKSGGDKMWLSWKYTLNGGGDPYAALEWNCGQKSSPLNMKGVDTIVITAKSGGGNVNASVQLISSDFNFPSEYQYFEDSLRLTATEREYSLPISRFKQRMGGSGKEIGKTLETMTGIRFHIQSGNNSTGTIMISRVYFTGDVSKLYTPPPPQPPPPGYIPPPPPVVEPPPEDSVIGVRHRVDLSKYSIIRNSGAVVITLPTGMVGASAVLLDIRGRTVMRMAVREDGRLRVPTSGLAKGMYFLDVKNGYLRLPVRNTGSAK